MVRMTRATSSGMPQRGVAVMPFSIRPSYFSFDGAVISVRIRPGCTSYTPMPSPASRSAYSRAAMCEAIFDMQYSPRSMVAATAFDDVTNTMLRCNSPVCGAAAMRRATAWARKKVPRVFTLKQPSHLAHVERVTALQHRDTGVVDEAVAPAEAAVHGVERVRVRGDVADVAVEG